MRDLEIARIKRDCARDAYKPSLGIRKLTKAALTTAAVCGLYILDRYFIDGDFLNNPELDILDTTAVFTTYVSWIVGGLGLMRRYEEASAKKKVLAAESNLDNLMKEYYEQETMRNLQFAERFHRHPR